VAVKAVGGGWTTCGGIGGGCWLGCVWVRVVGAREDIETCNL